MKRTIAIWTTVVVTGFILFLGALYIWNGIQIRVNIDTAREGYPGNAEEALIAMLEDTARSAYVRSHTCVWTLGQIGSQQALPILRDLYLQDPDGSTCHGNHDSLLCQYEIHKAIESIERNRFFSHARLKNR